MSFRIVLPALVAALALAACAEDGPDSNVINPGVGAAGSAQVETGSGAGGEPGAGRAAIRFSVRLVDARATPEKPLAGVEVCSAERPDLACAVSDASGAVELLLPPRSLHMLRCRGGGYGPAYMTWALGDDDIDAGTFSLLDETAAGFFVALSGGEPSATLGAITANVYEDLVDRKARVAGATFVIEPKAGGGPVYVGPAGLPDPSALASSEAGPALFFNLDPGEVTITIRHPTRACRGGFGWPAGDDASLRSKIYPGGLSNVTFVCPP